MLVLIIIIFINIAISFATNYWLTLNGFELSKIKYAVLTVFLTGILTYLYYVMGLTTLFFTNYAVILLLYSSCLCDLTKQLIPVTFMTVFIAPIVLLDLIIFDSSSLINIVVSLVLLALFAGLSKLSEEAIGLGDAYLIATVTFILGWKVAFSLTLGALALVAIFSVFALLFKFFKKKDTIPFSPFYAVAYLMFLVFYIVG